MQNISLIETESDITVERLNCLLQSSEPRFKQISLVKIAKLSVIGAMSEVRKIQLEYNDSTQGIAPPTLFVKYGKKLAPEHWIPTLVRINGIYLHEIEAYRFLQAHKIDFIPRIYFCQITANNDRFTIVMEDLGSKHQACQQRVGVDLPMAEKVVNKMAWLHGRFKKTQQISDKFQTYTMFLTTCKIFAVPTLNAELANTLSAKFKTNFQIVAGFVKKINFQGTKYGGLKEKFMQINLEQLWTSHRLYLSKFILETPELESIVHGDLRCENMLANTESVIIVDWQCTSVGNPVVDILRFLIQSIPVSLRRSELENLLKLYQTIYQKESGLILTKEFLQESKKMYIILEMDMVGSLAGYFSTVKNLQNLKERFEQGNRFVELSFVIFERTVQYYLEVFQDN